MSHREWAMQEGTAGWTSDHESSKLSENILEARASEIKVAHRQRNEAHGSRRRYREVGPLILIKFSLFCQSEGEIGAFSLDS